MLLYTPTFDLSIFIWLSPSLIILSSSISFHFSLYLTLLHCFAVLFFVSVWVCVCVLGRVKRLTDRKYSSSENSSLACMCSLKWKQRRSLTNIWMRPANCTETKNTLSTRHISIQDHQAIDIFSMSHKECFWNKTSFIFCMVRAFDVLNKLKRTAHVKLTAALLQRNSLGAKEPPNHSKVDLSESFPYKKYHGITLKVQ